MNKKYTFLVQSKFYLWLLLSWVALCTTSCTFYYTPSSGTFSGTTTYCQGATGAIDNFNYSECASSSGTFASGVLCTVQWYYNTTGGTTIATSTPLGAPTTFTSSSTGTGTLSYSPLTSTVGTFYYFAYITWGSGYCASPFLSSTQMINITAPPSPITGTNSVCIGSATTLTAPGSGGGTWHSANTSIATISGSGVVGGVSSGTAVISFTSTGCGVPTTVSVNVLPPPSAISGPSSVCVGGSVTLTDAVTGGTWGTSVPGVATIDVNTGAVRGLVQGTSTITYTAPSGCITTSNIAVNGPPNPIVGPSSVCEGSGITLTNPGTGGTWSSSNTVVATINSGTGVLTGLTPGTAVILYANGCGAPATTPVTVNTLPEAITGVIRVCEGASTTLSDVSSGTWSSTATAVATVGSGSGVVGGISAGTTTISFTAANGCAATTTVTVNAPLAPISGPPAVCQGLTVTLGGLPAGGTWTVDNTSVATVSATTGVLGGVAMGTALVTYTAGAGCASVRTMVVNPRAPIVGVDSVCQGLSAFLTNIVGGGLWSSSDNMIATVVPDSGRVVALAPGSATITYLLPTGCRSTQTVNVVSFPAAISGVAKACPGTFTNLSSATANGLWASSNTGIATVTQTGKVTGIVADTVTINYTLRPGCTVSAVVTVNPLPAPIFAATPICPGVTDSLTDATPGGTWSTTTPALATVIDTSGVATFMNGGAAVVVYTLPTGCYRTRTVSVDPLPIPTVTYDNNAITLYTPDVYASYQWYDSIGKIAGATSPSIAALYNEYYYVIVTDSFGCQGKSDLYHFNPAQVGVVTVAAKDNIRLYPNPTDRVLYIESPIDVRAVINSADGKQELEQTYAKQIDISNLPGGMYFITFYDVNGHLQSKQKFVKE